MKEELLKEFTKELKSKPYLEYNKEIDQLINFLTVTREVTVTLDFYFPIFPFATDKQLIELLYAINKESLHIMVVLSRKLKLSDYIKVFPNALVYLGVNIIYLSSTLEDLKMVFDNSPYKIKIEYSQQSTIYYTLFKFKLDSNFIEKVNFVRSLDSFQIRALSKPTSRFMNISKAYYNTEEIMYLNTLSDIKIGLPIIKRKTCELKSLHLFLKRTIYNYTIESHNFEVSQFKFTKTNIKNMFPDLKHDLYTIEFIYRILNKQKDSSVKMLYTFNNTYDKKSLQELIDKDPHNFYTFNFGKIINNKEIMSNLEMLSKLKDKLIFETPLVNGKYLYLDYFNLTQEQIEILDLKII